MQVMIGHLVSGITISQVLYYRRSKTAQFAPNIVTSIIGLFGYCKGGTS